MVPANLRDYIQQALRQGLSPEDIKSSLTNSGWQPDFVDEALSIASNSTVIVPDETVTTNLTNTNQPISTSTETPTQESIKQNDVLPGGGKAVRQPADGRVVPPAKAAAGWRAGRLFFSLLEGTRKFPVLLTYLCLAVIATIFPAYKVITYAIPLIKNFDQRIVSVANEVFPENLEIAIKDGKVTTNVTEPFYLTISQSTLENLLKVSNETSKSVSKVRLLTINTEGKAEDFERYQSMAMLTRSNLVYYDDGEVKIQSLSNVPNMVISRQSVIKNIVEFKNKDWIMQVLQTLLYISPVFILLTLLIGSLLGILINTIKIWIINKICLTQLPFGRLFRFTAALYALPTLSLVLTRNITGLNLFFGWFSTAIDVFILSLAYVSISRYKENNS